MEECKNHGWDETLWKRQDFQMPGWLCRPEQWPEGLGLSEEASEPRNWEWTCVSHCLHMKACGDQSVKT